MSYFYLLPLLGVNEVWQERDVLKIHMDRAVCERLLGARGMLSFTGQKAAQDSKQKNKE